MEEDIEKTVYEACTTPPLLLRDNTPQKIKKRLDLLREVVARNRLASDIDQLLVVGEYEDKKYPLKSPFTIGRARSNDLVLAAVYASRNHCVLELVENQWILRDLDSANGVNVNDEKVTQICLRHGDIIEIDDVHLIFFRKSEDHPVEG